jgi:hypothetical protein
MGIFGRAVERFGGKLVLSLHWRHGRQECHAYDVRDGLSDLKHVANTICALIARRGLLNMYNITDGRPTKDIFLISRYAVYNVLITFEM